MTSTPPSPLSSAAPATSFGEVGPDGTVFLRLPDGSQREVGQWAAGDAQAGLEFFARKYADLVTEIDVAAKRLADDRSTPAQAAAIVERVRKSVLEPSFVGDMAALVEAAAMLTYRAAWLRDCVGTATPAQAQAYTAAAAMAKMCASENAQRVIDMALQMHGGRGVQVGTKVESLYRDIRSLRIYEGATEVQQLIIGKSVLKS